MLTVTEEAKQLLKETLQKHSEDPETGIRLSVKEEGQFSIILDNQSEGDQVVEHEGAKVLMVSPDLANDLTDSILDVRDTQEGKKLFLSKEQQQQQS
jgi:Fe-S cluster assembly iron-binding protein IscA